MTYARPRCPSIFTMANGHLIQCNMPPDRHTDPGAEQKHLNRDNDGNPVYWETQQETSR